MDGERFEDGTSALLDVGLGLSIAVVFANEQYFVERVVA